MATTNQLLLLDADDTLWENNIYFEQAVDEFLDFLAHSSMGPGEVRAVLDEIERANLLVHGYGAASFSRSLHDCYHRLAERPITDHDLLRVLGFGERILHQDIELIAGVAETIETLADRHRLVLLTKGHAEEQRLKVDRSGLADRFERAVIVPEKDAAVYRTVATELNADPDRTWMVGNSPKSDINPALEAGLNAVFVPHDRTWGLERQDLRPEAGPGRLLTVERFSDLLHHF